MKYRYLLFSVRYVATEKKDGMRVLLIIERDNECKHISIYLVGSALEMFACHALLAYFCPSQSFGRMTDATTLRN